MTTATRARDLDDAKETAIVDAARRAFLSKGFEAASMDHIALLAGVSKRTVYNRFRSKEELFAAAINESCRRLVPNDVEDIEAHLPPEDFIRQMARVIVHGIFSDESIALRRIATFEAGRNPALGRIYFEHGPAYMASAFAPILERAARREGQPIDDIETAIVQLGALILEPLYTEALLGVAPDDLESAIGHQIESGLAAFWKIYGADKRD